MKKETSKKIYSVEVGILTIQLLIYLFMTGPPLPINQYNYCYSNNFTQYFVQQNISIVYKNCTLSYIHRGI